ncbi:MAG: type II 3-dehydroquinate dehydratase [Bacteroidota bacterium]
MNLIIINGPNLNLLGSRQTSIYGNEFFEDFLKTLKEKFPEVNIEYFQSNVEGEIINKLQEVGFTHDGIILNPGAYTHTSVAIGDTITAINSPVIEVHISNLFAREEYRQLSHTAMSCIGVIVGFGLKGYELAVEGFLKKD